MNHKPKWLGHSPKRLAPYVRYHVTYFYLATGMEGIADRRDYGTVEARSEREACEIVAEREYRKGTDEYQWMLGCLSAKQVGVY